jgi:hypothetical protein
VADAVVVRHQLAHRGERAREVGRGRVGRERLGRVLVLHHDDEDVLDGRQRPRRRRERECARQDGG